MEAGESRTPLRHIEIIPNDTSYAPRLSISNLVEPNFQQVHGKTNPEVNLSKLLMLLIDQLVLLGQTAQQIKHTLGRNGHQPAAVQKLMKEIVND